MFWNTLLRRFGLIFYSLAPSSSKESERSLEILMTVHFRTDLKWSSFLGIKYGNLEHTTGSIIGLKLYLTENTIKNFIILFYCWTWFSDEFKILTVELQVVDLANTEIHNLISDILQWIKMRFARNHFRFLCYQEHWIYLCWNTECTKSKISGVLKTPNDLKSLHKNIFSFRTGNLKKF